MIRERTEQIPRPAQGDTDDVRRYLNEYRAAYDEGLADMYERIDSNGLAIVALTDDVNITEPVNARTARSGRRQQAPRGARRAQAACSTGLKRP
jgi:hypothetical protein